MAAVRHLGIVLPPYPRSFCCWPQLPVKFHVNLIHRSEDIAIWIFRIFGLKCLFRTKNWGFEGLWTHKCDYSSSRPPKATSLHKSTSVKLSTIKIRWGVWPVGELIESVVRLTASVRVSAERSFLARTPVYTAIRWSVQWPLMSGLLHLVQRGRAWAGCGPTQSPPRCTKCNCPPVNGPCTKFILLCVAL